MGGKPHDAPVRAPMYPSARSGSIRVVETMRAIRKLSRERGLVLDEVPVPAPGPGEVLVRVEAASVCGTDLHIYRYDEWAARRIEPPLTLGHELCGTVVALGRERPARRRGRLRLGREPRHLRHLLPLPHGACAHVRAHADPRRRPRRRLRRLRRHSRVGDLAERPGQAAARARLPAGAVRERRLRHGHPGARRPHRRGARLRPGRAVHDRDRQGLRCRTRPRLRPRPVPASRWPSASASRRSRTSTSGGRPAWFAEQNEGEGLDVVFEMSGALGAVHDAFEVVRHGGHVVLFGIPARPAEIDIAESLIFKNLTVRPSTAARSGRRGTRPGGCSSTASSTCGR